MTTKKLNLGSGDDYRKGWVNIDIRNNVKLDVKHDLNKFPYPFKENTFDYVLINHVLEHVDNPIEILMEVIRISKNRAIVEINVPHAKSYSQISDIQHKANFTENSFIKESLHQYDLEELELTEKEFLYNENTWKKYIPFKKYLKIFFDGIYDNLYFKFRINKKEK